MCLYCCPYDDCGNIYHNRKQSSASTNSYSTMLNMTPGQSISHQRLLARNTGLPVNATNKYYRSLLVLAIDNYNGQYNRLISMSDGRTFWSQWLIMISVIWYSDVTIISVSKNAAGIQNHIDLSQLTKLYSTLAWRGTVGAGGGRVSQPQKLLAIEWSGRSPGP